MNDLFISNRGDFTEPPGRLNLKLNVGGKAARISELQAFVCIFPIKRLKVKTSDFLNGVWCDRLDSLLRSGAQMGYSHEGITATRFT